MFENMGDPGGIFGHRAQGDQEHVLGIVRREVVVQGAGVAMFELLNAHIESVDALTVQR